MYLLKANLKHDTEVVSKIKPYVKITYRDQEWSSTVRGAGKKPKWGDGKFFDIQVNDHGGDLHF